MLATRRILYDPTWQNAYFQQPEVYKDMDMYAKNALMTHITHINNNSRHKNNEFSCDDYVHKA